MEILKDAQNTMHQAHSATYSSLGVTHHHPVQRPPLFKVSGYYVYLGCVGEENTARKRLRR